MSLISDTSYLIHSLRLSYLREVDDPYGQRIISLDPQSYNANPYIYTSGLADDDRWPELDFTSSPNISDDESNADSRPLGYPTARLKHTQTIMGRRSGGMGLRVNGKRASISKRMSKSSDVQNFVPEIANNALAQESVLNTTSSAPLPATAITNPDDNNGQPVDASSSSHLSPVQLNVNIVEPTLQEKEEAPVQKVVQFIPKFKGAAEMEARRRIRMAARRGGAPINAPAPTQPQKPLSFDDSSSEDEVEAPAVDDDSSEDDDIDSDFGGGNDDADSMDDGDEFDPEFAATRTESHGVQSMDSASDSFIPPSIHSAAPLPASARPRLSPVTEGSWVPVTRSTSEGVPAPGKSTTGPSNRRPHPTPLPPKLSNQPLSSSGSGSSANQLSFTHKQIAPLRPLKSALTAILSSTLSNSSNPFAELYAAISGRGEAAATTVQVFFPHAREPRGKAMELNVRKDATVEEVIGFALWTYWEEGWEPRLDEGIPDGEEGDKLREIKLSAVGWILRLTEDDGEVDDDFPPPDRTGKIVKFNADGFAVIEATQAQVAQNELLESKIQRRPSRTSGARKHDLNKPPALSLPNYPGAGAGAASSAIFPSSLAGSSVPLSTSLGPLSSHGPQMFLRVRIADTADAVHVSTTIPVSSGMYMAEVLELVCRKRKFPNPNDYALLLLDVRLYIPLDRTVASLQGKRELMLVKKSMLPQMGVDVMKAGKTTDPNASIFKRMSDAPEVKLSSTLDYTAAYKKYTIYRKLPMLVARQAKTLAIDGQYVHIMPSTNKAAKAVFDSGRTMSYHIKTIVDCQQSTKSPHIFKLVLNRATGDKRYIFEAETPKAAGEIVQTVKSLKAALERSSTISKSRRSRQVV